MQEEAWRAAELQSAALCPGGSWVTYCFEESLLLDGLRCGQDGFALSLAGKGALKWDSAAPEVNFSWRSYIKVAGVVTRIGRKMVIAAVILVVEQTCASLLTRMELVTEVRRGHESRTMLLEIYWVPCELLDGWSGEIVPYCTIVTLLPQQLILQTFFLLFLPCVNAVFASSLICLLVAVLMFSLA